MTGAGIEMECERSYRLRGRERRKVPVTTGASDRCGGFEIDKGEDEGETISRTGLCSDMNRARTATAYELHLYIHSMPLDVVLFSFCVYR